jgi:hypothetical protein
MALYEFAWQLAIRLPGQLDAVALSRVFRGIGDALVAAGDPARAETVLTPAIQDPVLLADNAQDFLAPVLTSLAEAVFKQERPAEAVALCRRALEVSQQAHGELHPAVARVDAGARPHAAERRGVARGARLGAPRGGRVAQLGDTGRARVDPFFPKVVAALQEQLGNGMMLDGELVWMTPERAARYFASWEADQRGGVTAPALCRRCGTSLRFPDRPSSQLHVWCKPPLPPEGS